MTATLFLAFVVLTAGAVVGAVVKYFRRRAATITIAGLLSWLVYVGLLGYLGVTRNPSLRPPGLAFIFAPVALFVVVVVAMSPAGLRAALAVPIPVILGAQSFRIGVELLFYRLWVDGLVPRMLTFEGANFDIVIGLTAPLAAWASTRGRTGLRLALAWNVIGLVVLANVVGRAVMTAPGPANFIHAEVPNVAIGMFPYVFIPGFLAPLAVVLHVLAIRAVRAGLRDLPRVVG